MTSEPIRDPATDPLITPENSALLVIDYQPSQIQTVASIDHDLLIRNIVSVARLAKTYGLPIVLSTVGVAVNGQPTPILNSERSFLIRSRSTVPRSTRGRPPTSVKPSMQLDGRS